MHLRKGLNESQQLGKVGGSQTGDGIPSLGGLITDLSAARLSALVVTRGDILEDGGVRSVGLVEEGDSKTKRGLVVVKTVRVQESNDGSEDGGRARGSIDLLEVVRESNEVVVTEGGDIGETTVLGAEVLGRGEGNTRLEVSSNNIGLVAGGGDVVRETSSSGDQSSGVRANLLSGRRSALELLADGGKGASGVGSGVGELSGSDGDNPGGSSRENGGEGLALGRARWVTISRGTLVTRSSEEGDTDGSDLLELNVGTLDVLLGGLITSAVTNITLVGLGPSPGHGDNERGVLGGEEIGGEVVHPVSDGPEPDGGGLGDGTSVLDIQSGLSIGVRSGEGSNNVGDRDIRDAVLLGEVLQVLLVVGLVILELNKANGRVLVDGELSRDVVEAVDGGGDDVSIEVGIIDGGSLGVADGWELVKSSNEINVLSNLIGDGVGSNSLGDDSVLLDVTELKESGLQQALDEAHGSSDLDHITVINNSGSSSISQESSNLLRDISGRGNQLSDLLSGPPLSIVLGADVRDVKEGALQNIKVLLSKSKTDGHLSRGVSSVHLSPLRSDCKSIA